MTWKLSRLFLGLPKEERESHDPDMIKIQKEDFNTRLMKLLVYVNPNTWNYVTGVIENLLLETGLQFAYANFCNFLEVMYFQHYTIYRERTSLMRV